MTTSPNKGKTPKIVAIILVSILIFFALRYTSQFFCLTDDKAAYQTCSTIQTSIVGVLTVGLLVYGIRKTLRDENQTNSLSPINQSNVATSTKAIVNPSMYRVALVCIYLPVVILLLSLLLSNYLQSYFGALVLILGYIATLVGIPLFVVGLILYAKSKRP